MKEHGTFCTWSVNAGGVSTKNDYAELPTLCVSLKARSVNAVALQEPNVDFMQANIREKYMAILREHLGKSVV
jgi:hypothetical protein